jgi:AcrR family transcriptional regulator
MTEITSSRRDGRVERGDATRALILRAARELFAARGYADVGTNEVVERAGVTRGAMYHHFREKKDLFRAVYVQHEQSAMAAIVSRMSEARDPWEQFVLGVGQFLDLAADPGVVRIALIDAPAVLGVREWRERHARHSVAVIERALQQAMDAGVFRCAEVKRLAQLLFGAFAEAALLLAAADDPVAARDEVERSLLVLLDGLRA